MKTTKRVLALMATLLVFLVFGTLTVMGQYEDLGYDPFALLGFGGLGILAIILPIISLLIAILICVFMYKDAEKRGKSGIVWAIVGFICGCIGLVIWLLVRPPIQQTPPGYMPPPGYAPPPQQGYPPQQPPYQPPPYQPPPQ